MNMMKVKFVVEESGKAVDIRVEGEKPLTHNDIYKALQKVILELEILRKDKMSGDDPKGMVN